MTLPTGPFVTCEEPVVIPHGSLDMVMWPTGYWGWRKRTDQGGNMSDRIPVSRSIPGSDDYGETADLSINPKYIEKVVLAVIAKVATECGQTTGEEHPQAALALSRLGIFASNWECNHPTDEDGCETTVEDPSPDFVESVRELVGWARSEVGAWIASDQQMGRIPDHMARARHEQLDDAFAKVKSFLDEPEGEYVEIDGDSISCGNDEPEEEKEVGGDSTTHVAVDDGEDGTLIVAIPDGMEPEDHIGYGFGYRDGLQAAEEKVAQRDASRVVFIPLCRQCKKYPCVCDDQPTSTTTSPVEHGEEEATIPVPYSLVADLLRYGEPIERWPGGTLPDIDCAELAFRLRCLRQALGEASDET